MTSILASNLSESTTKQQVQKFFEFCGRIQRIDDSLQLSGYEGEKNFLVTFESASAKATALLLNGAELNGSKVKILEFTEGPGGGPENAIDASGPPAYLEKPADVEKRLEKAKGTDAVIDVTGLSSEGAGAAAGEGDEDIAQELKPKAQIFAEYLSQGYVLGDPLLQKAIEYDNKNGLSEKFQKFLKDVDEKYDVHTKGEALDKKLGISKYINKALNTGVGSRIEQFYNDVVKDTKQINDEALRLAELKKKEKST
jgi:hypothetical protein